MDTSRFKRRGEIQKRQKVENYFGGSEPIVVGALPTHPEKPSPPRPAANIDGFIVNNRPQRPISAVQKVVAQAVETPSEPGYSYNNVPLDMELPGGESTLHHIDSLLATGRWANARRWVFRGMVSAVVLVLVGGGLLFSQGFLRLHQVFQGGTKSAAALQANVNPNLLKGEGDGRINVLLLGRGGGNHDGPDLTDTMMLDSIDPINHTSTLISIPRDLWVDIPNAGVMKINAAWETGEFKYLGKVAPGSTDPRAIQAGFDEVDQTVENILGVTIHYNVVVDFQAFAQAVDTVGGINVNVPTDLVDPTMAWENAGNPVLAKAGPQAFDGKHALIYVRSRETTSDFARAGRQRAVLLALKAKVETLGTLSDPRKLSGLMKSFGKNVSTDLSLKDATRLYTIVKNISDTSVNSVGLADPPNHYVTTGMMAGQSIDLPTAGLFNYGDIQTFVRGQLKDPFILKENAKILVLNGTQTSGLATTKANQLKSYGYNVIGTANAPTSGWVQTVIYDNTKGRDKYTAHYLQQRFNVSELSHLSPNNTLQANGADFVIILGNDASAASQGLSN